MGNCINSQKVVSWADDDDDEANSWELTENGDMSRGWPPASKSSWNEEEEEEEDEEVSTSSSSSFSSSSSSSSSSSVVVKMRITKKQLNELLRLANRKGVGVRRVLAHVMNTGAVVHRVGGRAAARQWAPRLETIPEASENEALV